MKITDKELETMKDEYYTTTGWGTQTQYRKHLGLEAEF